MKKIMIIVGIMLLIGVELYAGDLGGVTTKVTTIRGQVLALIKVLAGFGLLFILASYTLSKDENRTFHWKWFFAALAIGAFSQILTLIGL